MSLVYALDYQLDRILAEGIEARFARHADMAERARSWAEAQGWSIVPPEGYRSQTLTVVRNPETFSCADFNKFIAPQGMKLANGYGDLKDKSIRIAHMGEIHMDDLNKLLAALDEYTQ